jgi:hypothetical protein
MPGCGMVSNVILLANNYQSTERCDSACPSHPGGLGFQFRPEKRSSWLRIFVVSFSFSRNILRQYLKTDPFQFIKIILTTWNWALLEKPPVVKLLKNFPKIYETRRFISLPCSKEPPTGPYPEAHRSILILSTHLRPGIPSGLPSSLFPSGFPTNILYAFLFSPCVLHALHISSPLTWSL